MDLELLQCVPATPLQYLVRMQLANEVFGDDVRFGGVFTGPGPGTCRIRTTQRLIAGERPEPNHIATWLSARGFSEQSNLRIAAYDAKSFHHAEADLWLFDVRPMNFVERDGSLYPIDVIIQRGAANAESDTIGLRTVSG